MSDAFQRRLSRVLTILGLLAAGYYALFGGEYDLFDLREVRETRGATVVRLDSLEARLAALGAWADSLVSDPSAIERVAREQHGFIRPGERLYRFVDLEEVDSPREGRQTYSRP